MDATPSVKAKTLAELLPGLSGILSKDSMLHLATRNQPCQEIGKTQRCESIAKPLTMAEMRAELQALKVPSPRRPAQAVGTASSRKNKWNSSVKVDNKIVSRTENKQFKCNDARKALNFQPVPKTVPSSRVTIAPESTRFQKPDTKKFLKPDLTKFHKPQLGAMKSLPLQARNNIRISGICKITETPDVHKQIKSRSILTNKENVSCKSYIKTVSTLSATSYKKLTFSIPDSPVSNELWEPSCDASFLRNEKEINDHEEKAKAIIEEHTLENIAEIQLPASTPFRECRSINDFFNHSNDIDNSEICKDDTIMQFDNNPPTKVTKREESLMASLCDLFKKTVVQSPQETTELDDLLLIEKEIEQMIECQTKTLQSVKKLIKEKKISLAKETT